MSVSVHTEEFFPTVDHDWPDLAAAVAHDGDRVVRRRAQRQLHRGVRFKAVNGLEYDKPAMRYSDRALQFWRDGGIWVPFLGEGLVSYVPAVNAD